jgi:rare lipoprotein A
MRKLLMPCGMVGLILLCGPSVAGPPTYNQNLAAVRLRPPAESGVASWYGQAHHGKLTASGNLFDMEELTAAHRHLPMGAKVRVTNLKNHKSVTLLINDRGPGIPGRLIDVSMAAARSLGFVNSGLVHVQVEVLSLPKSAAGPAWRTWPASSF